LTPDYQRALLPEMARLHHFDHLGTARFVTFSCYHRHPFLTSETAIRIFLEHLDRMRQTYHISIYGYVVVPEHVHIVLRPPDNVRLGQTIGWLKGASSCEIRLAKTRVAVSSARDTMARRPLQVIRDRQEKDVFWQRRCYDHNCRTPESVVEKINYCHLNPVKRGLVNDPGEWRWSSYNWYCGVRQVPLAMDVVE
jgi:putative transposase